MLELFLFAPTLFTPYRDGIGFPVTTNTKPLALSKAVPPHGAPPLKFLFGCMVLLNNFLPVLISNKCGSSQDLVLDNFNGFRFNPLDKDSIKKSIMDFDNLKRQTKREFSKNSITMSKKINHDLWASSLNSLLVI